MDTIIIFLSVLWSFLITVFAIPSIINVAHSKKLLDEPNQRTMHQSLTPRLGGLAIFAGFMSALTIFGELSYSIQHLLAGCIIIYFIGLKDDIVSVSAFKKFFVQILATGIIMFMGDIRITSFQGLLGIYDLEQGFSYAFTFILVIGITNAINLIDGLDGLAGTIILIISITFGVYFFALDSPHYSIVAFCLAGSILGFLRYNFTKAIIFMGDTGSLVSGFIISVLAIKFIETNSVSIEPIIPSAPAICVGILIIPIVDTLRVSIIRILNGKSPFSPDKNHLHHRLIALGFSQMQSVLILAVLNILVIAGVVYFAFIGTLNLLVALLIFSIILSIVLEIKRKPLPQPR
ncbi:MAG TPA: MraY family glycosyltransferase [Cytophagales bacterium]|nr:MraY family glycosyltransferase [Cytophagales bacterium]